MSWLQAVIEKFEDIGHNEPGVVSFYWKWVFTKIQDLRLRDEFFCFDENDPESVKKADNKFNAYLERAYDHAHSKGRLKRSIDYGDHPQFDNRRIEKACRNSKFFINYSV